MLEGTSSMHDAGCTDFSHVTEAIRDFALTTGRPPLMLGGWEVEDDQLGPPAPLLDSLLAIEARPRGYAYTKDFAQAKEVGAAVFGERTRLGGEPPSAAQVAVLHNSSQGLLLALTALRDRGVRQAVIAAPTYFTTFHACRHLGLDLTIIPAADFLTGTLDLARLAGALHRGPTVVILTNPAYCLGVEYGAAQVRVLCERLPGDAVVLLDETRLGPSWRYEAPWYEADLPAQTLILRSPSKVFLLNGLKTSFLVGPAAIIREVERLGEVLLGSVAGNSEAVALAYLEAVAAWQRGPHDPYGCAVHEWRARVVARLHRNLGEAQAALSPYGFAFSPVDSGPYALAGIERRLLPTLDGQAIARESGVLLMTSDYFFHESDHWTAFRLNLACDQTGTWRAAALLFSDLLGRDTLVSGAGTR